MADVLRQIAEELPDLIEGEVRTDAVARALYGSDASLYHVSPTAVVMPKSADDVARLCEWASNNQVPLTARGAGSGLAGSCLGEGIVVDFSRHMTRVEQVGSDSVRVQPGVVLADLNKQLRQYGRCFAPDPSTSAVTTVGGMVGVDAAGSHAVRVGSTRDHVRSLKCVLAGGQQLEFGTEPTRPRFAISQPTVSVQDRLQLPSSPADMIPPVPNQSLRLSSLTATTRYHDLIERLAAVLEDSGDLIRQHQPMLLRNSAGYMLRGVLDGERLHLPRLLTGSEGTLALFTELTLHTMPLPAHRSLAVLMFARMDSALEGMHHLLDLEPSACDLLDRRLLTLLREANPQFADTLSSEAEAGLFVEFTAASAGDAGERIRQSTGRLADAGLPFVMTRYAEEYDEVEALWKLPAQVTGLLAGLRGNARPLPFVEDIAVPPDRISEFLTMAQRVFQRHRVTATLYAHAASGQLHLRPILPNPSRDGGEQIESIARELYRFVLKVGGTISGEHGDGLSRTAFLRSQYGPLYPVFRQVKDVFDPDRILSPDRIVSDDGRLTVRHLRRTRQQNANGEESVSESKPLLPVLHSVSSVSGIAAEAERCNGCGVCRSRSAALRMCPFFHLDAAEEVAPRAKANALRVALTSPRQDDLLSSPEMATVAESCFNCGQCIEECPSHVDIPHLAIELRSQGVAARGLSAADWLLSRFHTYAGLASRLTVLTNRLIRNSVFRKLLRRTIGIAPQRRLPRFARRAFLRTSRVPEADTEETVQFDDNTVVYFVDYFANHHDPQLAEALVRVLQHNGLKVHIPAGQTISGMAMVNVGDIEALRAVAAVNLKELAEPAREGCPIICSEPSAALCLRREYPHFTKHADAEIVASQTLEIGEYLNRLHAEGRLRTDFRSMDLKLVYHRPCHVQSLGPQAGLMNILQLVPGLEVTELNKGCSGMAGTFGLAAEHFEQSVEIGAPLIRTMQAQSEALGVTDCSSCRMQMEQSATVATVHPIKILAIAYGLMPELEAVLRKRPAGLLMS